MGREAESDETYWEDVRSRFLYDEDYVYLNTGSWGVLPRIVYEDLIGELRELERNPTRNRGALARGLESARKRLGTFTGASANDLAFVPNVTVAINTVVNGLDWNPGDEILASDQEYGAIDNCLDNARQRWGVSIRRAKLPVPPDSPDQIVDAFKSGITSRTRLLLCSHITTRTGLIAPIKALSELAHEHDALIAFDGAHGIGMSPLDLEEVSCDFYGGNCHKWLCAPKGVGFLYASPRVQTRMKHLVVSWGYNPEGPDETGCRPSINGAPYMRGIETWGTMCWPSFKATGAAVAFQQEIGQDRVAARSLTLVTYLREACKDLDWIDLLSPTHPEMSGSITTLMLKAQSGPNIGHALFNRYRITAPVSCEVDGQSIRVSTHIYNKREEVDRLVEALIELRQVS